MLSSAKAGVALVADDAVVEPARAAPVRSTVVAMRRAILFGLMNSMIGASRPGEFADDEVVSGATIFERPDDDGGVNRSAPA